MIATFPVKNFTDLNNAYEKCNWKVKILTQTAVSDHDGITNFYSDHDNANLEWGGTVFGIMNHLKFNLCPVNH